MRIFRLLICAALLFCLSSISQAGGGPENVLVVVNIDSWASKTIANEYVQLRRIPSMNVVYLKDISTFETISVDDFRKKILKPVMNYLEKRKLLGQIDCIAYSSDLPYSVSLHSDIAKLPNKLSKFFTPVGSINGMTYLTGLVMTKPPYYIGLSANNYVRKMVRLGVPLRQQVKRPTKEEVTQFNNTTKLQNEKKWKEAATKLERLAKAHPRWGTIHYNLACCRARLNQFDKTIESLDAALDAGWVNSQHALKYGSSEELVGDCVCCWIDFKPLWNHEQQSLLGLL